jgi:hypothetical protein
MFLKLIKKNRKMSTCNRLDLETLESRSVISPDTVVGSEAGRADGQRGPAGGQRAGRTDGQRGPAGRAGSRGVAFF